MFKFVLDVVKTAWKALSWLRVLVLNVVFLVFIVVLIGALSAAPEIEVPNNSALLIAPSGVLVDQSSYNPTFMDALQQNDRLDETVVRDIVQAIRFARDDDQITGIILRLDFLQSGGLSKIEEIGQALQYFKESNKPIVAYADSYMQQQYLLATYADEIYVNSMGGLYITGFGVFRNYYKNAADKLALKFHVFRVGDYKDAVEPFLRDDMSEASREHVSAWLTQLWQRYTASVEARRTLPEGTISRFVDTLHTKLDAIDGDAATLALENGLVDGVTSRNTIKNILKEKFGESEDGIGINAIDMYAYLNNPTLKKPREDDNKIGLIVASGNILDGYQPEGSIGSETLSNLIRQARENESLNALVLRIDSGGGSAFASEVIREELELAREQGLPVYVSMGSVAASGGYWIATPATEVWATPATLTGSIGVFGLVPNVSESLNKIGVNSDGVATSSIADAFHLEREMSDETKTVIQSSVDNIYQRFIHLVADARDSSPEDIHEIAQGRVWSGETALELGLVDKLGSLEDVFASAAKQLGLQQYAVEEIKRELSPQERFIRALMEQADTGIDGLVDSPVPVATVKNLAKALNIQTDIELLNQHSASMPQAYAKCIECFAP